MPAYYVYRDAVIDALIADGWPLMVERIELRLPPDVPYGFAALPQYTTEDLLTGHLEGYGTRVERGCELLSFEQDAAGVDAVLQTPAGTERVRCRHDLRGSFKARVYWRAGSFIWETCSASCRTSRQSVSASSMLRA